MLIDKTECVILINSNVINIKRKDDSGLLECAQVEFADPGLSADTDDLNELADIILKISR